MRTKLILTTAALGVAGSLGAVAQVYSVNAVGYINKTVAAGKLALIVNQLNTGGNTVAEVIPSPSDGTTIYKYVAGTGFSVNSYTAGLGWDTPTATLKPGEGAFVRGGATDVTITFVGEVPIGSLTTALNQGLNLTGSQVPQEGKLQTDLGYTPADGDIVYQWNETTQGYTPANSFTAGLGWDSGEPNIKVAEGFFLIKAAAGSWARTFSVNPQ
jgi:hypothetical protein